MEDSESKVEAWMAVEEKGERINQSIAACPIIK